MEVFVIEAVPGRPLYPHRAMSRCSSRLGSRRRASLTIRRSLACRSLALQVAGPPAFNAFDLKFGKLNTYYLHCKFYTIARSADINAVDSLAMFQLLEASLSVRIGVLNWEDLEVRSAETRRNSGSLKYLETIKEFLNTFLLHSFFASHLLVFVV